MKLDGATALITGSNRGIGLAIARALSEQPLDLLLMGMRSPESAEPLRSPAGGARKIRAVRLDLGSQGSIGACAQELGELLSGVDLLVNNAGLMTGGLLEEQPVDDVYSMFQVNLVAVAHLTALVLPGMLARGRGKVVNNASISGYVHLPAGSTYAASKAGVVALTESLRRELKGTGVSALHLVTPGVDTEMLAETEEAYGRYMDTSGWEKVTPEEWAGRVLEAIRSDVHVLGPGGPLAIAKLASRGPARLVDWIAARMFSRTPRG